MRYRPDIDGLRAVAVLLVIFFHAFPKAVPGGYVGVDVFFVISGYLITGIINREISTGCFSIADFYARRCRRILPALFLILVSVWAMGALLLLPDEFTNLGAHLLAAAGFVSNFLLLHETGYFAAVAEEKPLLHLWSLAIEEQFYLIWPVVLVAGAKWGLSRIGIAAVLCVFSLILSIWLVDIGERAELGFFMLPTRLWELAVGGLLAIGEPRIRQFLSAAPRLRLQNLLPGLGLAILLVAAFKFSRNTPFPGWHSGIPVVAAALVIVGGIDKSRRGFLGSASMVFIGLISYPLYLWHWPLLAFLRIVETEPGRAEKFAAIGLSFVLAWLTRKYLEQPVRRTVLSGQPIMGTRAAIMVGAGSLAVVGAIGLATHASLIHRPEQDELVGFLNAYRNYNAQQLFRIDRCDVESRLPHEPMPECLVRQPGQAAIFLWGDSHAEHLYPGLAAAYPQGVSILQVTSSGCAPLLGHRSGRSACDQANQIAIARIVEQRPDVVLISGLWTDYVDLQDFDRKFHATMAKLRSAGVKSIVVVGGVPQWHPTLYQILARRRLVGQTMPERMTNKQLGNVQRADSHLVRLRQESQDFAFVSLTDRLCEATECLIRVGGGQQENLIAFDYGHMTRSASEHVVGKFVAPEIGILHGRVQ
jgi:peptidoglycan/LPS O-acetylase OafA/YrhL